MSLALLRYIPRICLGLLSGHCKPHSRIGLKTGRHLLGVSVKATGLGQVGLNTRGMPFLTGVAGPAVAAKRNTPNVASRPLIRFT